MIASARPARRSGVGREAGRYARRMAVSDVLVAARRHGRSAPTRPAGGGQSRRARRSTVSSTTTNAGWCRPRPPATPAGELSTFAGPDRRPGVRPGSGRRRVVRGLRRRRALHRQRLHRGLGRLAGPAAPARSGAGHRSRRRWWAHPASPPSPSAASMTTRPGYYSTGEVRFGTDGHFWTYPQRMSPLFGVMVAESIRTIVDEWTWAGRLDDVDPLTILELGGGEGRLALDVLDHVWSPTTETWASLSRRVCATCSATAARPCASASRRRWPTRSRPAGPRCAPIDAVDVSWDGPFRGAIVANELLDALAHECLRVDRRRRGRAGARRPKDPRAAASSRCRSAGDGSTSSASRDPARRARPPTWTGCVPMVEQVRDTGEPPADLYWAPALPRLIANLADVLRRPGLARRGHASSTTATRPSTASTPTTPACGSTAPTRCTGATPTARPGSSDLTWDVDFGEVGRLARRHGLRVRFAGPQGALEVPPDRSGLAPDALDRLVPGRVGGGGRRPPPTRWPPPCCWSPSSASPSSGYRVMMLAPADVPFPDNAFGPRQRLG